MNRIFWLMVFAASVFCFATLARANDTAVVTDALIKAQEAMESAPAYQTTITRRFINTARPQTETYESFGPGLIHMKSLELGRGGTELITDGKREFLWEEGRFVEEHGDAVKALAGQRNDSSLFHLLIGKSDTARILGHEMLDGKKTSVYSTTRSEPGSITTAKIWVSDTDHRPLKVHVERRQKDTDLQPEYQGDTSFSYDPSVQVELPVG